MFPDPPTSAKVQTPIPEVDEVNFPPHYTFGKVECNDAIRAAMTEAEFEGYLKGSIIKYLWRDGRKTGDATLDRQKAAWYLAKLVEQTQK